MRVAAASDDANGVLTKYKGAGGDVTIPNSVTSIGDGAFSGCSSLIDVYYIGSEVQYDQISGDGQPNKRLVHFNSNGLIPQEVDAKVPTGQNCIHVIDENGKPLKDATVAWNDGVDLLIDITDAEGNAFFDNLNYWDAAHFRRAKRLYHVDERELRVEKGRKPFQKHRQELFFISDNQRTKLVKPATRFYVPLVEVNVSVPHFFQNFHAICLLCSKKHILQWKQEVQTEQSVFFQ